LSPTLNKNKNLNVRSKRKNIFNGKLEKNPKADRYLNLPDIFVKVDCLPGIPALGDILGSQIRQ
jgi:hypothetical protein